MNISELDTPALLVDLDIFEKNLRRVADYAAANHLRLRPHTKTHKSPEVAQRQLELGAAGLTVAKVGEAEILMQKLPPVDLLVAFPVIGEKKRERLKRLAEQTQVTVAIDSLAAAEALGEVEAGVLVEMDVGLGRVGVTPAEALDLARELKRRFPHLRVRGLTFYPGHIKGMAQEEAAKLTALAKLLDTTLADFHRAGMEPEIVSGGSTPTLFQSHEIAGLNEIRPGTYVYNDLNTIASGTCTLEDCAASILVTVISTPRANTAIVDGGSKTFSSDRLSVGTDVTFGRVQEAPGCRFHKMNEEHGFLDTTRAERSLAVGDRVRIVPNHVCVAVNLHERVYGVRNGVVEKTWAVEARGKLQ